MSIAEVFSDCATAAPTGAPSANGSQSTLGAITLDGSGIVGATSYAWTVSVNVDGTWTPAAAIAAPTAQSTSYTPEGPGEFTFSCAATNATGTSTFRFTQVVTRPRPVVAVASRVDGESYTVSAGARTLTLSETNSADISSGTWLTAGERASTGSAVSVTDSGTTTPDWTAADAAGGDGEGDQFTVSLTDDYGRVDTFSFTERVAGAGGGGGGGGWTDILDWSSSSEAFSGGEDTYTIGGLSVVLDYDGSAGPDSIDLTNGVLTIEGDNTHKAYLVIDLGEDFENVPLWACCAVQNLANVGGSAAIWFQMADDQTLGNSGGHWQDFVGMAGVKTTIHGRYATNASTFVDVNIRTGQTDVETTPTRVAVLIEAVNLKPSFDQGTAGLPTTGADLGTVGPNSYGATGGAYTTTAARNQRYMHLRVACDATIELFAAKRA
jgi:hypothetical protein